MGLAICVGYQADLESNDPEGAGWARDSFAATNDLLDSMGLPGWTEPPTLPADLGRRASCGSFPYSFLHYLRRAYALTVSGRPVEPTDQLSADDEEVIADIATMMDSHLLCHSDCEGFYVPVDFTEPLFDFDRGIPGNGMVGSSHALLRELRKVAPTIGVELDANGALSDAEAQRLFDRDDGEPFWRETLVFLALWEAARVSIEHGTAIVFS